MRAASSLLRLLALASWQSCADAQCPACSPTQRSVLDVVVPFFQRDLCKLKVSVKSWLWRDPESLLGDLYLVWTSSEDISPYSQDVLEIAEMVHSYGKGRTAYLLDFSSHVNKQHLDGWFAQQIVKLKIASMIKSDFYVVMDAKNTFVKDIPSSFFWSGCNQSIIYGDFTWEAWHEMPLPHRLWFHNAAELFNVTPEAASRWSASTTPLTMHRLTVLDMLAYVGESTDLSKLCDGPLCEKMSRPTDSERITEFSLYLVYALMRTRSECTHYTYVTHVFDSARTVSGKSIEGATGGGVLNIWRNRGESDGGESRLDAAWTLSANRWYCQILGFQHGSLDDMPFKTRSKVAFELAKVYRSAGLYNFSSLDEFARCLANTNLKLTTSEAWHKSFVESPFRNTSNECLPAWLCTPGRGAASLITTDMNASSNMTVRFQNIPGVERYLSEEKRAKSSDKLANGSRTVEPRLLGIFQKATAKPRIRRMNVPLNKAFATTGVCVLSLAALAGVVSIIRRQKLLSHGGASGCDLDVVDQSLLNSAEQEDKEDGERELRCASRDLRRQVRV